MPEPKPAPLPVLAGVYYGRTVGHAAGRQVSQIFTFHVPGRSLNDSSDLPFANAVATALAAHWPTLVGDSSAGMNAAYSCQQAECYALGSVLAPKVVVPMTGAGSDSAELVPIVTSALIKHEVNRRGRGSQSRTNMSPLSINSVAADGESLLPAYRTALQLAFDTFMAAVLADLGGAGMDGVTYVQLSKFHNDAYAPATYAITASAVEVLLSTQRRRGAR